MMKKVMPAFLLTLAMPLTGFSATIHVPADQPTIQAAIDLAVDDDEIRIAAGTYTEPMLDSPDLPSMLVIDESLTLVGEGEVILDAGSAGRVLYVGFGEGGFPRVEMRNITITHGLCTGDGGGALVWSAYLIAENVEFISNEAWGDGGALATRHASLSFRDCNIEGNDAENGGGFHFSEGQNNFLRFYSCRFRDNRAAPGRGGAFHLAPQAFLTLNDCLIRESYSWQGGWAFVDGDTGYLTSLMASHCSFVSAGLHSQDGGFHFSGTNASMTLSGCIVTGARGSAATCEQHVSLSLGNCNDVWGNGGDYTDAFDGWEGLSGNFSADPMFCNPAEEDFHLHALSPCAPANNDCGVLIGALPVACGIVAVEEKTWGALKALY